MVYTDKIHLVADSLDELHEFAIKIGLKRHYYHGVRKGHPHYDLLGDMLGKAINAGAVIVDKKTILLKSISLV